MSQHLLSAYSSLDRPWGLAVTTHRRRIVGLHARLEDLRGDQQAWAVFDAGGLDGSTAYKRMEECLRVAEEQLDWLAACFGSSIETETKGAA